MKRISYVILFLVSLNSVHAQNQVAGNWTGKLQAGVSLRLVLHIKDSLGIHVTMDSPDQSAFGLKAEQATLTGDSLTVLFTRIRGKYVAVLQTENYKQQLKGTWHQAGMQFPLILERGEAAALVRPQTPKAPFNYAVEEVTYTNADKSITFGGTLTKPKGTGKFPAVILISGSGQQDRDETILGHKPFWVIADHLTKNGFAVLRVDDRGTGKTTGMDVSVTSRDFADDVMQSLNYLKTRPDIDTKQLGLIGHSEGGMIAPMVAAKTKDVAYMVLVAGPAVKGEEVLNEQRVAILKASGLATETVNEIDVVSRKVTRIVVDAATKEAALSSIEETARQWASSASNDAKAALSMTSDEKIKTYSKQITGQLYTPWFRYFLKFDPAPELVKSKCPVLAIYGGKDLQVIPAQNLEPMKQALSKTRKAKDFSVIEIPGLNHLFQTCNTCTPAEYGELTQTFSEDALVVITDWLQKTTGKK